MKNPTTLDHALAAIAEYEIENKLLCTKLQHMIDVFNVEEIDPLQAFLVIEQAKATIKRNKI